MSRPAYNIRRLTWIARILVLAAAVGIGISSYVFYVPYVDVNIFSGLSWQLNQAILYGGSLLVLAGLMWFWPGASSILALLWVFFRFMQDFGITQTQTPLPLYFFLYGMFIVGSVIHLITAVLKKKAIKDVVKEKAPRTAFETSVRIRWVARILSLVSLVAFAIALTCIGRPEWLILALIIVIPFVGAAWVWSVQGGIFIVLGAIFAMFGMMSTDYGTNIKMAVAVPCLILLASGVLYLISAEMQRGRPS
jgi:hypothetical protein